MTAEKDNKVYTIDESMKDRYVAEGYDIKDDDGSVIAYGKGKTVPYEIYQKVLQELEMLRNSAAEDAGNAKKTREASRKNP